MIQFHGKSCDEVAGLGQTNILSVSSPGRTLH